MIQDRSTGTSAERPARVAERGPQRATNTPALLDFKELLSGQVYRVVRPFRDADDALHDRDECFTYLTRTRHVGVREIELQTRDEEGALCALRLPASRAHTALIQNLGDYLERVEEIPADFTLRCLCETDDADWACAFHAPTVDVLTCCRCSLLVALEPVTGGGRFVRLDGAARAAALRASTVRYDASFLELLETAVACQRHYPAGLMVITTLSRRNALDQELARALASTDAPLRLAALSFIAHVPHVPAGVELGLVHALHDPLHPDPCSEEVLNTLEALARVAERVTPYRMEVARIRDAVRRDRSALGRKIRNATHEVLRRIDWEIERSQQRVGAAISVLRTLTLRGALAEADAWVERCGGVGGGHELVNRASLCEGAADRVAVEDPAASRWLYRKALWLFQEYAALQRTGEGQTRTRHVRRVAQKLEATARTPSRPGSARGETFPPPASRRRAARGSP